jgi:protein-S-isoprenylcysteine O-methyltransferase Ste14
MGDMMDNLLFLPAFVLTLAGYMVHTIAHFREYRRGGGAIPEREEHLVGFAVFAGYLGWGAMLATDPLSLPVSAALAVAAGAICGGAGLALFLAAAITKHSFGESSSLVTTGVYAKVRHPMYTGLILMHLGFPLLTGSALTLLSAALWIPLILLWGHWEEIQLEERFGEEYRHYKAKTRW